MSMQKTIACDWLQLHVQMDCVKLDMLTEGNRPSTVPDDAPRCGYNVQKETFGTRHFSAIYSVNDVVTGEQVAYVCAEPRSEICMRHNSGLIKINNKYLYRNDLYDFVKKLLQDLKMKLLNVTRLDIALDMLSFDTMSCKDFIQDFVRENIFKLQSSVVKTMGKTSKVTKKGVKNGITSVKFGKESSDVTYILYNKSLELAEKTDKPWIKEHWKSAGWKGKETVYRLEFSIKRSNEQVAVVNDDGEVSDVIGYRDLECLKKLPEIFKHFFNKCFTFYIPELTKYGNYKKPSRCKKLELLKDFNFVSVRIALSSKKDANRSDRVFLKKLMRTNQELRGDSYELGIIGNHIFTAVCCQKDLQEWAAKKLNVSDTAWSHQVLEYYSEKRNVSLYQYLQVNGLRPLTQGLFKFS